MDPATIALITSLVREVGIPVVTKIVTGLRRDGHATMADAIEKLAASDATLDSVIETAKREQR